VSEPWAFFSFPTRAWELLAGAALAIALPRLKALPGSAAVALGWAGLALIAASACVFDPARTPYPGVAALVPVTGAAAVVAVGCAAPRLGPVLLLGRAPMRFAGRISYSWYLWHWPVLVLAAAIIGHRLAGWEGLASVVFSGALALATARLIEDPARHARTLLRPARALTLAAALPALACVAALVSAAVLPPLHGGGTVAAPQLPATRFAAHTADPGGAPRERQAAIQAAVGRAVAAGVATRVVPSNLDPGLDRAFASEARPFTDGCHDGFTDALIHPCTYGDAAAASTVVLFGDSHATQWFPALDRIARARHWRLVSLTKSTCPPLPLPLWQSTLGRWYTECDSFRNAALKRMRLLRPTMVILGVARHYGPEYRFGPVYGPGWIAGMRAAVEQARAVSPRVVVLGPTPLPAGNVPDCLSGHLTEVGSCTRPRADAVNEVGMRSEQAAVQAAGGSYLRVTDWVCAPVTCPVIVGNLLLYRDDNHLSVPYTAWLAPALAAGLDASPRAGAAPPTGFAPS
jgi:hypothetical protein